MYNVSVLNTPCILGLHNGLHTLLYHCMKDVGVGVDVDVDDRIDPTKQVG